MKVATVIFSGVVPALALIAIVVLYLTGNSGPVMVWIGCTAGLLGIATAGFKSNRDRKQRQPAA